MSSTALPENISLQCTVQCPQINISTLVHILHFSTSPNIKTAISLIWAYILEIIITITTIEYMSYQSIQCCKNCDFPGKIGFTQSAGFCERHFLKIQLNKAASHHSKSGSLSLRGKNEIFALRPSREEKCQILLGATRSRSEEKTNW